MLLQVLTSLSAVCNLFDIKYLYTFDQVLPCILAPKLTQDIFIQAQKTVENLTQLYSLLDHAKEAQSMFNLQKVDVAQSLLNIRTKYQQLQNPPILNYFSELSKAFFQLRDPHTLFIKSTFFSNFAIKFPFIFEVINNDVYMKNKGDQSIAVQYKSQFGEQNFDPNKKILKINNLDPIIFLQKFADTYSYRSKSAHARLNSMVQGELYDMRLDHYNILEDFDKKVNISYDDSNLEIQFIVTSHVKLTSEQDAQSLFEKDLLSSPYLTNQLRKTQNSTHNKQEDTNKAQLSGDFKIIHQIQDFFTLYKYSNNDLVLQLQSFGTDSLTKTTLNHLYNLLIKIKENQKLKSKLYISVLNNPGGSVLAAHLLAASFYQNEYPIFGKYNIRKSPLMKKLILNNAQIVGVQKFEWLSGNNFTNPDQFYEQTQNQYYSQFFGFLEDFDISKFLKSKININPNQLIILTDGLCSSACATFVKHLNELNNSYVIGYGGLQNSSGIYESASAAAGAYTTSVDYENSIVQLIIDNKLNAEDNKYLSQFWFPHNGFLQMVIMSGYSFNSAKAENYPLEYSPSQPQLINHNFVPGVNTSDNLEKVVKYASIQNISFYGEECDHDAEYLNRMYVGGNCVRVGCQYGYYRVNESNKIVCSQRVDQFLQSSDTEGGLNGGEIAGIVIATLVGSSAIGAGTFFAVKKKKQPKADDFHVISKPQSQLMNGLEV